MAQYIEVAFNVPLFSTFTYDPGEAEEVDLGYRVEAQFGRRKLTGWVTGRRDDLPEGVKAAKTIKRVVDKTPLFDAEFLDLAKWISGMYMTPLGEVLSAMLPGGRRETEPAMLGMDENISGSSQSIILSEEQKTAIDAILGDSGGFFYLFGITGSGKTEVFLQAAEKELAEGKDVIYLVPEISLTHQLLDSIRIRFGDIAAVLHSGLTPSQRLKEWMRIRRKEARLVIGARSAIFAPVTDLGLIIIDEEHEGSYKSGRSPRYNARQIAMKRCKDKGASLVMGSATPSVEAYHHMNSGILTKLTLTKRLSGGAMPEIKIVDMKKEGDSLSKYLVKEIHQTHQEGRQSILFLNRRGFSYYFHCKSCGFEMVCRQCSVPLTLHKNKGAMVCHYCGYQARPVKVCPDCGSMDVGYSGVGTEKIEEDIRRMFPTYVIERIDADSVQKKGELQRILGDFKNGKIDILLGTQMVAKGLNFPKVKLVGIVMADTGLHLPDFRAAERTFSLIVQVSGRAGRYMPDGKVIIQTYNKENTAIKLASRADLATFYKRELDVRKMLGFPPFKRLFRFVFRGKSDQNTKKAAESFSGALEALLRQLPSQNVSDVLGPAECPIAMIAGNHRYQLIIRTGAFSEIHANLFMLYQKFKPPYDVYIEIDVDPVSLL